MRSDTFGTRDSGGNPRDGGKRAGVVAALVLCSAALSACGGSTPEQRTRFSLSVAAASDLSALQSDDGYTVTLTRARVGLGQLTFYAGDPITVTGVSTASTSALRPCRREAHGLGEAVSRALRWLWPVGTAHAHPGHYEPGGALAELRVARSVDLAAGPTALGSALGVTGDYRSFSLAVGSIALVGRASKGGQTVAFSARLALDKTLAGAAVREGFEAREALGEARLEIDVAQWIARVDFARLAAAATGSVEQTIVAGSQAHNALVRGSDNVAALSARWLAAQRGDR